MQVALLLHPSTGGGGGRGGGGQTWILKPGEGRRPVCTAVEIPGRRLPFIGSLLRNVETLVHSSRDFSLLERLLYCVQVRTQVLRRN